MKIFKNLIKHMKTFFIGKDILNLDKYKFKHKGDREMLGDDRLISTEEEKTQLSSILDKSSLINSPIDIHTSILGSTYGQRLYLSLPGFSWEMNYSKEYEELFFNTFNHNKKLAMMKLILSKRPFFPHQNINNSTRDILAVQNGRFTNYRVLNIMHPSSVCTIYYIKNYKNPREKYKLYHFKDIDLYSVKDRNILA